jgi:hypothetical protein
MQNSASLSTWQKKQIALLYHFASLSYLKELSQRVNEVIAFGDQTLDTAKMQRRDALLISPQWGERDTSSNWSNNAWPMLADFQVSIAGDIAKRAFEVYSITDASNCRRGLSEYSMDWMTPEEQLEFERRMDLVSEHARNIDYTMDKNWGAGVWDDFLLTQVSDDYSDILSTTPKMRLRADVTAVSGSVPFRTGVYIPLDDPNGAPQFCWTGKPAGELLQCNTLNALGLEVLTEAGRENLWVNDIQMANILRKHVSHPDLSSDYRLQSALDEPDLASSFLARHAFTSRPCEWIYVEQIHGELEDWSEASLGAIALGGVRIEAGAICGKAGYYFTPARPDSRRYFVQGQLMPTLDSSYGATIWQWDLDQKE